MLVATVLFVIWPLGTARGAQPAGGAEPTVQEDFNGDSIPDLAIGAPDETLGAAEAAGVVHVLYGSTGAGLTATGSQLWSQDSPEVAGTAEGADFFGQALAASDFNGEAQAELAVGAPGENVNTGVVHVLLRSAAGLTATGSQLWSQDSPEVAGNAERGDFFGDALVGGTLTSEGGAATAARTPSSRTRP